ncbi:AzlC family ABC transporter permease [Parasporobacterium paucivorans]|uniref:Predicted branched-chain amino acid permease (Azaleucine resistance) n=1 Tax=Parasporobacterium paucivorans DSM 15970 TaxID=1122934 RepID=A0A1M6FPC7_9FIRM|nr:AzlC family ABC transporter permease [Parasporobacterium paucivorans]SHI99525.1 Predicted branched-chain amino acid permease (azaleucine resistance) [Parasporobacterium paucivorans DSM 15970]
MNNASNRSDFRDGFFKGLPIALGYIPVSFTFGFMAVSNGLPVWMTVLISMSNLTSSGQFAGTNLILAGAGYLEITITTFIINIRYMLMSLALSQKLEPAVRLADRLILAFGITDETFAVSSMENGTISKRFFYGLISAPYFGWALGTFAGATASGVLPKELGGAMGIALYAMFIALIIPPAAKSRPVLTVVLAAVAISCIIRYIPFFSFISTGFRVILATLGAAALGALFFPQEEDVS